MLLSQRHPFLYFISVWEKRFKRYATWYLGAEKYASQRTVEKLPVRVLKHQSVLIRKLGVSDMRLQYNKVTNLKKAIAKIDGIIVKPGDTFSFCKLVGLTSKRKGYLEGMELSFGKAKPGIGGGLCQISNLINWLVLHSPLTVTEIHHHSFDPFTDEGRVLPFGSGATVFFNYLDFCFKNNTENIFQINLWLSEKCLEGELRIDSELDQAYHIFEKEHEFLKCGTEFFRKNEIWREKYLKFKGGAVQETELLKKNFAKVMYEPETFREINPEDLNELRQN